MSQNTSTNSKSFSINQKNNRFILKLFGEMNHEHITIEKDEILTISKMRTDNFEKKGQISKWQFNLDRIYTPDMTFDELYENEIENTDYLHEFNKKSQYNTLTFIGDKNDSSIDNQYKDFIIKCVKECLNGMKKNEINNDNLIPVISFYQINKSSTVDYLKENDINNNITKNNMISNSKLILYEDDILIKGLSHIKFSNENEFLSLLNLAKKNLDNLRESNLNKTSKEESSSQILTLKLLKSNTNECFSKINIVLYKAYEILNIEESQEYQNIFYNIYTKDNYNFFNGIQNKINSRLSYIIKYLKDTLIKGNNLFIIILPCEFQYLLLIHDILNNINKRKLIVENILLNDEDDISNDQLGEIYRFENVSELNLDGNDIKEDNSFQSFSKNNSLMTNVDSILVENKAKKFLYSSYYDNKLTEGKKKRKEINYERLRKIDDKNNVIKLFDMLDKFLM
jgi:hypothetical protein